MKSRYIATLLKAVSNCIFDKNYSNMTTQIERFRALATSIGIDGNDVTMLSRLSRMGPDSFQGLFNIYVSVHPSGQLTYDGFRKLRYLGIPIFADDNETTGALINGGTLPFEKLRKELYRLENEYFPV